MDLPAQMCALVALVDALAAHERRFGIGAQLALMIVGAVRDVTDGPHADELSLAEAREFDLALIGLEFSAVATSIGIADPRAFAAFLTEAAQCEPDPAFDRAAATIVGAVVRNVERILAADSQPDWNTCLRLQELATAARSASGALAVQGRELDALALHAMHQTGTAFALARRAGLYTHSERAGFGLRNLHRDAIGSHITQRWSAAFDAIDACPATDRGNVLWAQLIDRAAELLLAARADQLAHREEFGSRYEPSYFAGHDLAYSGVGARLDQLTAELRRSAGHDLR